MMTYLTNYLFANAIISRCGLLFVMHLILHIYKKMNDMKGDGASAYCWVVVVVVVVMSKFLTSEARVVSCTCQNRMDDNFT